MTSVLYEFKFNFHYVKYLLSNSTDNCMRSMISSISSEDIPMIQQRTPLLYHRVMMNVRLLEDGIKVEKEKIR